VAHLVAVGRRHSKEPEAARALEREHDEGFLVEDGAATDALLRAAEARGLRPSHGGRSTT
jgi:hypothetical protein